MVIATSYFMNLLYDNYHFLAIRELRLFCPRKVTLILLKKFVNTNACKIQSRIFNERGEDAESMQSVCYMNPGCFCGTIRTHASVSLNACAQVDFITR
jgi:hypothetical protein